MNLFVAYYANPRAGEAMHSPKHFPPGGGWEPIQSDIIRIRVDGRELPLNR